MDFSAYSVFQEEEVIKEEEEVDFRKEIEIALNQRDSEMRDLIGSGGFANVYTIWNRKYQQMFCAKVIKLKNQSETHKIAIENEIQTLVKVVHKNIICIFDHFKSENCYYLILEYCPNGSLEDVIKKHGGLPLYDFVVLSRQLLNAIAYCHSIGIAHRDFKPTNILFDAHNRPKLADFGLAQFFEKNKFETRKFGGSLAYMAPELALKQDFSPMAVDIWAL